MFAFSLSAISGGMLMSGIWMAAFGKNVLALSIMFSSCVWNDLGRFCLLFMPTLSTTALGVFWGGKLGAHEFRKVKNFSAWKGMQLDGSYLGPNVCGPGNVAVSQNHNV
jgi:hypothetical protein